MHADAGRRHATLDDALGAWLAGALPLAEEAIPAAAAGRRVLARPVRAWRDVPGVALAGVDGFAVAHAGAVAAGTRWALADGGERVAADAAWPVSTGDRLPAGTGTVVPVEATARDGRTVVALRDVAAGVGVRRAGSALAADVEVESAGDTVTPERLPALLAAAGGRAALVGAQPHVHLLGVGNELADPGRAPEDGQLVAMAAPAVALRAQEDGALARWLPAVPDDAEILAAALARAAASAHVVVVTGGLSGPGGGTTRAVLARVGARVLFDGLRVRPGRPSLGARLGDAYILAVPSSPVAALLVWELLGRPLVARLAGAAWPAALTATLAAPVERTPMADDRYLRASAYVGEGRLWLAVDPVPDAGTLASLARTDAWMRLPAGRAGLAQGDLVEALVSRVPTAAPPSWAGPVGRV